MHCPHLVGAGSFVYPKPSLSRTISVNAATRRFDGIPSGAGDAKDGERGFLVFHAMTHPALPKDASSFSDAEASFFYASHIRRFSRQTKNHAIGIWLTLSRYSFLRFLNRRLRFILINHVRAGNQARIVRRKGGGLPDCEFNSVRAAADWCRGTERSASANSENVAIHIYQGSAYGFTWEFRSRRWTRHGEGTAQACNHHHKGVLRFHLDRRARFLRRFGRTGGRRTGRTSAD